MDVYNLGDFFFNRQHAISNSVRRIALPIANYTLPIGKGRQRALFSVKMLTLHPI